MSMTSIGDMRQHFLNLRHNTTLKERLATLAQELTTGQAADLTAHLGHDQARLVDIDRQLALAEAQDRATSETGQLLAHMQVALSSIDDLRGQAAAPLLQITTDTPQAQRADAADEARLAFEGAVQALNTRFGDRAAFAGTQVGVSPLAPATDMLADILASMSAVTDAAGVIAALDLWFDDPGGGFATMAYQGSVTDNLVRPLGQGRVTEIDARADDPALKSVLKAAAMGAIATDSSLTLSNDDRAALLRTSGEALMTSAAGLTSVQAGIGYAEARVEQAAIRNSASQSALTILRNDLVSADPYQTATELEQVQLQLETHYTLTARLSRLSLTEYLR